MAIGKEIQREIRGETDQAHTCRGEDSNHLEEEEDLMGKSYPALMAQGVEAYELFLRPIWAPPARFFPHPGRRAPPPSCNRPVSSALCSLRVTHAEGVGGLEEEARAAGGRERARRRWSHGSEWRWRQAFPSSSLAQRPRVDARRDEVRCGDAVPGRPEPRGHLEPGPAAKARAVDQNNVLASLRRRSLHVPVWLCGCNLSYSSLWLDV